ncbi:MAG: potassium transporter Kup [Pseudomonadota bacterium]
MDRTKPAFPHPSREALGALTLGAIGVVYGDIGTSPLYTVKEIFAPATGVPLDAHHLVGAISAIFWALMVVVTLKYVVLVLRADNRGEGGALALAALAAQAVRERPALRSAVLLLGVAGAALFYGDSVLTPAISVLGAMEGLEVIAPSLKPWVVPGAAAVLVLLFAFQRFGTARVGALFGPVIVVWFATLAYTGVAQIMQEPAILSALNPLYAWQFLVERGPGVLLAVGAIVLALTGAEALYADMGHFGRAPIRLAWLGLVFPALALNYLGQGALLMRDPSALENPFFRLFPAGWLVAALVLATLAAIIASQAVISGAYSVTRQAIQLGFLPRLTVRFTSARESGQIYLPAVNAVLLAGVVGAVFAFGSSSALAGAYGISVTLTMLITTVLTWFVIRRGWRLPAPLARGATGFFLAVDLLLVAGCASKLFDGGWFTLALAAVLMLLMTTWARGRSRLLALIREDGLELEAFVRNLSADFPPRAARTAVYAVADPTTVPQALLHNMKHNQVLHERNVVLTVDFGDTPWVDDSERLKVEDLGHGFWRVRVRFGFMEAPDVPRALELAAAYGIVAPRFETSYFLSRETVVPTQGNGGMRRWREQLFAAMSKGSSGVAGFFRLPDNAVVELGTRVQI